MVLETQYSVNTLKTYKDVFKYLPFGKRGIFNNLMVSNFHRTFPKYD